MRMGKKCTNAEMALRVRKVGELILMGASRCEIIRFAAEKWDVGERMVDTMMERARAQFEKDWDIERPAMVAQQLARMQLVTKHAFKNEDFRSVISASRYQAELARILHARPSGDSNSNR